MISKSKALPRPDYFCIKWLKAAIFLYWYFCINPLYEGYRTEKVWLSKLPGTVISGQNGKKHAGIDVTISSPILLKKWNFIVCFSWVSGLLK